ncbi:MAG: hypothetical protein QG602_3471 [Verrucomicrobiota bacterium]|nr:hypothetical protein [Verrucomicrobiota bacterium]
MKTVVLRESRVGLGTDHTDGHGLAADTGGKQTNRFNPEIAEGAE